MPNKYYLIISEKEEIGRYEKAEIHTPVISLETAYYWAKRTVKLGSEGVSIWKDNGSFVDIVLPKSKETE